MFNEFEIQDRNGWPSEVPTDDATCGLEGPTFAHSGLDASSAFSRGQLGLMDHSLAANGVMESSANSSYTNGASQSYSGTSPADLNDYDAQIYDDEFLLEKDFGPLPPATDSTSDPIQTIETLPMNGLASISNNDLNLQASQCTPPRYTYLKSHTTHLMSPELTDSTSPDSGYGVASPVPRTRLLGGGAMSRVSSQSTATDPTFSMRHYTPALTGSSAEASPEPASVADVGSGASPVVRIESYSRGDSPARVKSSILRSSSKRSRASRSSSHLAAPNDDTSDEEETGTFVEDQSSAIDDQLRTTTDSPGQYQPSGTRTGLNPQMRAEIIDQVVLNFNDQDELNERETKKADVQEWLRKNSDPAQLLEETHVPAGTRKYKADPTRRRAKSAVDPNRLSEMASSSNVERLAEANLKIPGPGLMLYEDGRDEYPEHDSGFDSEIAPISVAEVALAADDAQGPEDKLDAHPWLDPIYMPSRLGISGQPCTSNAAMARYEERAKDLETASRKATWATSIRRLSETDLDKILGPDGIFSRLSVSKDKIMEKVDRRGSSFAAKLRPKRSNSNVKRKPNEVNPERPSLPSTTQHESLESLHRRKGSLQGRKESLGGRTESSSSIGRMSSIGKRPKSPKLNTGGAVVAMANQIAALGGNGSFSPTIASSPTTNVWTRNVIRLKRTTDNNRPTSSNVADQGIAALWTKQGGPPLPTLASPPQEKQDAAPFGPADEDEDGDTDEISNEKGVLIDFTPRDGPIIPTKEGFKQNIREVNSRLPAYLEDRLAQEQLRRFKRLVNLKIDHIQAVQEKTCQSGNKNCPDLGGAPSYFPSKNSKKELEHSHTGFSVVGATISDTDANALPDGVITASQFQPGIPMPPATKLPAEFECPLCFTVRKINKPSDWSKHVHEDLQPFTCTFPDCSEPKSFKRKADWVRHENERHRQLEWWICSKPDCQHKCYRRDNFVQHLVREHKLSEPSSKNITPNRPAVRGPAKNKARDKGHSSSNSSEEEVSALVVSCRHETTVEPQSEPCRFCEHKSNNWKKLTVHLAKHMEQLSIPVLGLVKQKDVTPDTVISPIEQIAPSQVVNPSVVAERGSVSVSPYSIPPEMATVKQEPPGPFTPLHNKTTFNHLPREHQVAGTSPWGQPNDLGSRIQPEASQLAYSNIGGGYDPSYNAYNPPVGPPYFQMNIQHNHMQSSRPGDVVYNEMGTLMPQVGQSVNLGIQTTMGPYQTSMPFSIPRYVDQNQLPTSRPQQVPPNVAMSPPYGPHSDMPYPQVSNPPTLFQNQQQQYYSYSTS